MLPYSVHEMFKVVQCCDVVVMYFKLNIRINIPYGENNIESMLINTMIICVLLPTFTGVSTALSFQSEV